MESRYTEDRYERLADLAAELPTMFEPVINLMTAQAIGLMIPVHCSSRRTR